MRRALSLAVALAMPHLLSACAGPEPAAPVRGPDLVRAELQRALPPGTVDAAGWAADIQTAFSLLGLPPDTASLCAVVAVVEQESSFNADPAVPGLASIAWKAIDERAASVGVPGTLVRLGLGIDSLNGQSYARRIDAVRTERQLSEIFEEMIGRVPLGQRLFGRFNPVRTGGPMQVSVAFAQRQVQDRPYPFADARSIRDEVFSRRGGLYFGIAHLLDYPTHYDRALYRFADFNAGRHASRNAAFQNALNQVAGTALALDGDLLVDGGMDRPGATEQALRRVSRRIGLSDAAIRRDLRLQDSIEFESTALYREVFRLADQAGQPAPRAMLPNIRLHSPKFSRALTTRWFAERVDARRERCMARVAGTARSGTRPQGKRSGTQPQ